MLMVKMRVIEMTMTSILLMVVSGDKMSITMPRMIVLVLAMVNMSMVMMRVGVVTIEWFDDGHGVDCGND